MRTARRARRNLGAGLVLIAAAGPRTVQGEDIWAAGNEEVLWLVGQVPDARAEKPLLRFAFRGRTEPTFQPPAPMGAVVGEVARLAVRGTVLHVLYRDGSHWWHTPQGQQQLAASLPRRNQPLAWVVRPEDDALLALVDVATMAQLRDARVRDSPDHASQPATTRAAGEADVAQTPPEEAIAESPPEAAGLVRYAEGGWKPVIGSALGEWFDEPEHCWLAAERGEIHLVYRPASSDSLEHARLQNSQWSDPISTQVPEELPGGGVMVVNKRLIIVHFGPAGDEGGATHLRIQRYDRSGWERGPVLHLAGRPQVFDSENLAVTPFGQNIAVAERLDEKRIKVTQYKPGDGELLTGSEELATLEAPVRPVLGEDVARWLLIATIALLFLAAMRRRRMSTRSGE